MGASELPDRFEGLEQRDRYARARDNVVFRRASMGRGGVILSPQVSASLRFAIGWA